MQMKKMAAIFLALVMVLSVAGMNVLADTTPAITVESAQTTPGGTATFKVDMTNFSGIKGLDVTITATAGATFTAIASDSIELTKDGNYTLEANKIHIVDLNGNTALTFNVTATVNDNADVSVEAKLATSGTALAENVSITNGKLTVAANEPLTKPLGTKIRSTGDALRFGISASCAKAKQGENYAVDYTDATVTVDGKEYKVARVGALAARKDLTNEADLVVKSTDSKVVDVEAKKGYKVETDHVEYMVTATGIPESAYDTEIMVRPYVAYYESDNNIVYVYGDILSSSINKTKNAIESAA